MNKKIGPKLFTLCVIVLCLFSCGGKKARGRTGPRKNPPLSTLTNVKHTIVLCHGLGVTPASLKPIQQQLQQAFPKASILAPHQQDTYNKSIEAQGKEVVSALQAKSSDKKKERIVLVGHSQGGLRAYWAALQLAAEGHPVAGVATIGTPWEGVPAINQATNISNMVSVLKANLSTPQDGLTASFEKLNKSGPGLEDMKPQSPFLQQLHTKLLNNNIALLAIGGDASQWATTVLGAIPMTFTMPDGTSLTVAQALDYVLGGSPHDMLIPLASQRADHIQAKNLTRHTVQAVHGYIPPLPEETSELAHPEIMKKMITLIGQQLGISPATQ